MWRRFVANYFIRLSTFTLDTTKAADCWGYEPIWAKEGEDLKYIGFTTSGGYGHHVGKSIAMGMIDKRYLDPSHDFRIHVVGDETAAKLEAAPLYDPSGEKMFKS